MAPVAPGAGTVRVIRPLRRPSAVTSIVLNTAIALTLPAVTLQSQRPILTLIVLPTVAICLFKTFAVLHVLLMRIELGETTIVQDAPLLNRREQLSFEDIEKAVSGPGSSLSLIPREQTRTPLTIPIQLLAPKDAEQVYAFVKDKRRILPLPSKPLSTKANVFVVAWILLWPLLALCIFLMANPR